MPTVPRYQRQVAPQQRPSGALRAVETETSAGVGAAQARVYVGRGAEQLGGAIADVGSKFLNIAYSQQAKAQQEAKDYADQLAVLGANNKLSNFERTLYADGGAFTLQGEAAFHLPETVNAQFDKTADEIEFGLTNPEQKLAFARLRSQRGQSIALDVERHVSGEIKQFAATELQASKANNGELAILKGGAGDFTRAGEAMDAYANDVRTIGKRLGMPDEAITADISAFRSTVHEGIINQLLADGQNKTAKLYFDETKDEIAGNKRDDVTNALKEGNTKQDAQQASDQILAEGGTLQEQREKAKQIENPDVRDATLSYIEHEDAIKERVKREGQEEQSKSIANILDTGRGIKAIPINTWKNLDDTDRTRYRQYAESVASYGKGGAIKTKPEKLAELITLSTTPALRDKWLQTDIVKEYLNDLSPGDLEQALRKQGSDRQGKSTPQIFATEGVQNEIINAGLRKVGIDPAGKMTAATRERLDAFRRVVHEAVEREYPPTEGQKPSREAIQSIVDTLTAEVGTASKGWWPTAGARPAYAYEVPQAQVTRIDQVPLSQQRAIRDAYASQHRPPPSDAEIVQRFNMQLQKVRKDR